MKVKVSMFESMVLEDYMSIQYKDELIIVHREDLHTFLSHNDWTFLTDWGAVVCDMEEKSIEKLKRDCTLESLKLNTQLINNI